MSQHTIENLIEDTVYLIDDAALPGIDKRDCFRKLYRIQAFYDTGYTHFRVMDILLKHGFVHRIPLEAHPDYAQRKTDLERFEAPGWLETDAGQVYVDLDGNQRYLYVEAGDPLWERLCASGRLSTIECRPLPDIGIPKVLRITLEEAERQGAKHLLNDWYGLLVNGYVERVFDESDGFPRTFEGLLSNDDFRAIRQIAQRNGVKRLRGANEDVLLPDLRAEVAMAKDVEEAFTVRFFLDLRKTPEALSKAYEKAAQVLEKAAQQAKRRKAKGENIFDDLIHGKVGDFLLRRGWHAGDLSHEHIRLWYRDKGGDRQVVWVQFDPDEKFLLCQQGLQQELLLTWQQRKPDTEIHHLHFYRNIQATLSETEMDKNKHIHPFGGWKFDPAQSKKILESRIDNLVEALERVGDGYFDYLATQFPARFFERDPERLLHLLEEGEDETGIIPDFVLFDSPYSILFAFAFHHSLGGDDQRAAWCIERTRAVFAGRPRKSAYITQYVEPFLEKWPVSGTATPLPPLYHIYLHRKLAGF